MERGLQCIDAMADLLSKIAWSSPTKIVVIGSWELGWILIHNCRSLVRLTKALSIAATSD